MKRSIALAAAVLALALGAEKASALNVPYTENFTASVSGWENGTNSPLAYEATGSFDSGSYASTQFNYFGFSSPFGGGPVIFRANDSDNASGDAFVGNWITGGVVTVSAWVYQETGQSLNYFLRVASSFNFPGAVIPNLTSVASNTWTELTWAIDPNSPLCIGETVTCAAALASVGNLQFGTDAPASLVATDQAFFMGIDNVTVVPEPGQAILFGSGLIGLAIFGRRRKDA